MRLVYWRKRWIEERFKNNMKMFERIKVLREQGFDMYVYFK